MFEWLGKIATTCLTPVQRYVRLNNEEEDSLIWEKELEPYHLGEFSIAVVQGNSILEDHSLVESGPDGIFVGVYDGHAGPEASVYVADHLYLNFSRLYSRNQTVSVDILREAFEATEMGFTTHVRRNMLESPIYASFGTCSLVGVIWKGTLYVANAGDSRAVLGFVDNSGSIVAEQLTTVHNANVVDARDELQAQHPDDQNVVVQKQGVWRVRGIIQVTKSIGDFYLKTPEFAINQFPRFHLSEPIRRPILTAEPSVYRRALLPQDRFVIFASDGLWDYVGVAEAAEIVAKNGRKGIARRLIVKALEEAARKHKMTYSALKKVEKGKRRAIYDDITVVVVFIDQKRLRGKEAQPIPKNSIRGFGYKAEGVDVASSSTQGNVDASGSTLRICESSSSTQGNVDASGSTRRSDEPSSTSQEINVAPSSTQGNADP
ncbi:hypothetical protein AQUCO_00900122v1, partial [Aquilegia coerulea]